VDVDEVTGEARQALSADPEVGLRAAARLVRLAEQLEAEQVAAARDAGWTWQEIALRLGVTKQTVHRKYRNVEGRR
jgi:transcriptional regulator of acetoin/glycerol metabolism